MNKDYLINLTPEERIALREKAKASREAKKVAGESLKQDYSDEAHWRSLASQFGFRLAPSYEPSTNVKYIRRLLKHIGKDSEWIELHTGCKNANEFSKMNPNWKAYAVQGCLLESYCEELS
jgi:hypothetical protein